MESTNEEHRIYYCSEHAPAASVVAQPAWPFWKCAVCKYPATHWVVMPNVKFSERSAAGAESAGTQGYACDNKGEKK